MVRPIKRRQALVKCAQQLLTAVAYIKQQKQIPNVDRLSRYMQREHELGYGETKTQLTYATKDGLLVSYTAVGVKGSKTGLEQEGYRIPVEEEAEEQDDGHDWYCFECHKPGEVLECSDCWRVFHTACTQEDWSGSRFICSVCREMEAGRKKNKIKKKMLNTLLAYTVMRLKEKTRELHKIGNKEEDEMFQRFIYRQVDLNSMEQKVQASKYKCLEEFQADAQNVLHNVYLLYGDEKGGMTELARIMIKDCRYDLDEVRQCPNCYHLSNSKPADWFCQPCNPSHELVYAKQKGFSYWPAKVIKNLGDKYDVRFFGGYHQRAVIPKENVKLITTSIRNLTVKRTAGFVKACHELQEHQALLGEGGPKYEEDEESDIDWEDDTDNRQVTSTSLMSGKAPTLKASSPEDSLVVTSSEDKITGTPPILSMPPPLPLVSTASQTTRLKVHSVHIQTDEVKTPAPLSCLCQTKGKDVSELRDSLKKEHSKDKEHALSELSDRLQKDFEEDKQQAVARAMTNMQREIERTRRQTEEKCKEQYMEEMKKLAQKHKEAISQTKKKQWCFNCEEEAMYHCCWNTSYCSVKCQQEHWHKEHKRVCRRKRS